MKDTPETRDRLRSMMAEGSIAKETLSRLEPAFTQLQQVYLENLVHEVRYTGDESSVYRVACRLAALDDVYEDLHGKARAGAKAEKIATDLEAGSE